MPNFVEIAQTVAEIWRFFQDGGRAAVRHHGFVMHVSRQSTKGIWWSLSLQNLVGIDAVVLICMFFGFHEFGLKVPKLKIVFLGG